MRAHTHTAVSEQQLTRSCSVDNTRKLLLCDWEDCQLSRGALCAALDAVR